MEDMVVVQALAAAATAVMEVTAVTAGQDMEEVMVEAAMEAEAEEEDSVATVRKKFRIIVTTDFFCKNNFYKFTSLQ